MPTNSSDREPFEVIAEDFSLRQRSGERVSIERYAARYPQWATEIRDLFPMIAAMEGVKEKRHAEVFRDGRNTRKTPRQIDGFRLIREIGRGGMGVVYEAQQIALNRRVAIKMFPEHMLQNRNHRLRFEREACTAGKLHHTNIVPVYGVGEDEGQRFYIMQYIDGIGFDQLIHQRHALENCDLSNRPSLAGDIMSKSLGTGKQYWLSVAQLGMQLADALDYAHGQDTLHRDIKPANLLLDKQGVAWITDFGLARLAKQTTLTTTGQLLGTLRYLAPEQLEGHFETRSDIFCLGLTLYELATLRPAYDEAKHHLLVQQVVKASPIAPRVINPQLPEDLESIILKTISREIDNRYTTAGDLAADLRRFLEDRPV